MLGTSHFKDDSIYYLHLKYDDNPDVCLLHTGKYIKSRMGNSSSIHNIIDIHTLYEDIIFNMTKTDDEEKMTEMSMDFINNKGFGFINDIYDYMLNNNSTAIDIMKNDEDMYCHNDDSYKSLLFFIIIANLTMLDGFYQHSMTKDSTIDHKFYTIYEFESIKEICDLIDSKLIYGVYAEREND